MLDMARNEKLHSNWQYFVSYLFKSSWRAIGCFQHTIHIQQEEYNNKKPHVPAAYEHTNLAR